jgi:hypothetical protein
MSLLKNFKPILLQHPQAANICFITCGIQLLSLAQALNIFPLELPPRVNDTTNRLADIPFAPEVRVNAVSDRR